jgi:hypothetical protein
VTNWVDTLAALGVEVASADAQHVALRHAGRSRSFLLDRRSRQPRPSELAAAASPDALLIAPKLSVSSQERLLDLGWSWITDAGQVHLRFGDHVVSSPARTSEPASQSPVIASALIRGIGTFAVIRRLLVGPPPASQADLALTTGVTQPRVSQILQALVRQGLVTRYEGMWRITDWDYVLQSWLAQYPGPGGTTTCWTGLDDVWSQAVAALSVLPGEAVVSGDLGADLLAPWRQPRRATVYVPALCDLKQTGLVQVGGTADTAVAVCVPDDRSVWPAEAITRSFRGHRIRVADPIQVLWDMQAAADDDSIQAAEQVARWLSRTAQTR